MSKSKTTIYVILASIVLVGGLWWFVSLEKISNPEDFNSKVSSLSEIAGVDQSSQNEEAQKPGFFGSLFNTDTKAYNDSVAKFSFRYPKEYNVKEIPPIVPGEGKSILFFKEGSAPSIQITVSDFDEDITLTIDRIKRDVPDLPMKNAREFDINSSTNGVAFGDSVGINVWFVAKKHLFQISAFNSEIPTLEKVLSSFSF